MTVHEDVYCGQIFLVSMPEDPGETRNDSDSREDGDDSGEDMWCKDINSF